VEAICLRKLPTLEDKLTAQNRHIDQNAADFIFRNGEGITREDYQICQLAASDRALQVFLTRGVGARDGVGVQGFGRRPPQLRGRLSRTAMNHPASHSN
jgi:hypothetical protein